MKNFDPIRLNVFGKNPKAFNTDSYTCLREYMQGNCQKKMLSRLLNPLKILKIACLRLVK